MFLGIHPDCVTRSASLDYGQQVVAPKALVLTRKHQDLALQSGKGGHFVLFPLL